MRARAVMFYATAISDTVGLIQNPVLPRNIYCGVYVTIATLISITQNRHQRSAERQHLQIRWRAPACVLGGVAR